MNQVNNFLKSYGITLPDGTAREQSILSGVYGVAEGLCLGVNPITLGAVKAIDALIYKMTSSKQDERANFFERGNLGQMTVQVISFAACAGALYAGGFAVPVVSRIAASVGLIVLQPIFGDQIENLAGKLAGKDIRTVADLAVKGFTIGTLIGADPVLMITVELINNTFKRIFKHGAYNKTGFSLRDQHLFSAAFIGILYKTPFMVQNIPAKVATIAVTVLLAARTLAHNTTYAPWLQNYI